MSQLEEGMERYLVHGPDDWYEPYSIHRIPERAGVFWTKREDQQLLNEHRSGSSISTMAALHSRSARAIEKRLEELRVHAAGTELAAKMNERKEIMNKAHYLITLLQQNYTTVAVSFVQEPSKISDNGPLYTYKISKDIAVEVNDLVVVPAKDKLSVARVVTLHEEPEIDPAVPYELKWVVCAVDRSRYDQQISKEKEVVSAMLKGERRAAKEKALAALMELVPNLEELRLLLNGGAK